MTRRLLAALLLALAGLVAWGAAPAGAQARCPDLGGVAASAKRASDVFTGTVETRTAERKLATLTVTVDRVYKGSVDSEQVEVDTPKSGVACGIRATSGDRYVFFAQDNDGQLLVARGDGTARATDALVGKVEALLGDGQSPTPPEPEQAVFTMVAGEPADFQRLAAPGAALVIIGILGFALVAWRGRHHS